VAIVADLFQILVAPTIFEDLEIVGKAPPALIKEIEDGLREVLTRRSVPAREMALRQLGVPAEQGDVVLADINYPDGQGPLPHPAAVLSDRDLLITEGVFIIASASSQQHQSRASDVQVVPGRSGRSRTGLDRPTWFSPIPRTVGRALFLEKLGGLPRSEWEELVSRTAGFMGL